MAAAACRAPAGAPRELSAAMARTTAQRPHRSLPKGQHLLLVGRVAVRLNETAGPAGQPFSIAPRHARLWEAALRRQPSPTTSPNPVTVSRG